MRYAVQEKSPLSNIHVGLLILILFDFIILFSMIAFSPFMIIAVVITLAALALIYIPRMGYIYFLLLWLPFESLIISDEGPFEFYRLTLLVLLLVLAWTKYLLSSKKIAFPNRRVFIPIAAIYIWSVLSTLLSPYPIPSLLALLRMVTYLAMFVLVYNLIRSEKDLRHIIIAAFIALLPTMLSAVYQWFTGGGIRTSGLFKNPNTLSMYAVYAVALAFMLWKKWQHSTKNTLLFILFFCIALFALLAGGARASLLSFLVFAIVYLFYAKHYKLMTAVILMLLLAGYAVYQQSAALMDQAQALRLYSGSTGRTLLWANALPMILDYPIFGVGYGAVGKVLQPYVQATHPIIGYHLRGIVEFGLLHNGFLQKAAELGLIGMGIYIWINISYMKYLRDRIYSSVSPFVINVCLAGLAFMFSRMAFSLFESAEQYGPLTTQAGMMVILTGILKVADL
ncbi:MAG: hypothetical protein GF310_08230, partial [candidate division Zixibacteria bacterium]|nr:hypothetical protein [candidate division Zixibacteria bacterium]